MTGPNNCPSCGAPLPEDNPSAQCGCCLLRLGLTGAIEAGASEIGGGTGALAEQPGDRIGPYKLVKVLGEGGCGKVYLAEQERPVRRQVALKIIKLGMDTAQFIARFEAERQALAMMDHPSIARVFDAGATDTGRPFFVMELVRGERITDYCNNRRLPIKARLQLFSQVCQAIQHAHQKGIIHRDLKPSNVLVAEHESVPVPKVIDFGIAKATGGQELTDKTLFTAFEQFIGTPAYMSPEQAGSGQGGIDTRSDIYSLGVLLYELLTGRMPFEPERLMNAGLDEIRRIIREEDPPRPSTHFTRKTETTPPELLHRKSEIESDLDWIVMRAMEKDPARRYATATEFARDLLRHLNHEPVEARPPSHLYRLRKTARRHKLGFTAGGAVAAALLIGLALSSWGFFKEKEAREVAVQAQRIATTQAARSEQVARILKDMLASAGPSVARGRDATMLREILDKTSDRVATDLKEHPEVEAELRFTLGAAYLDLLQFEKAEQQHRAALELRHSLYGESHSAIADSLAQIAGVLLVRKRAEDVVESEALARRALAIRLDLFGNAHLVTAQSQHLLGNILMFQQRHPEAETLQRQALATSRELLPSGDHGIVQFINSLVAVLSNHVQRLDEAEALARESISIQRQSSLTNTPSFATSLHTLSLVLLHKNEHAEAETVAREGLQLRENLYGPDNSELPFFLNVIARSLSGQGRWQEAESYIRRSLALRQRFHSKDQSEIADSLDVLTGILHRDGRWAEAVVTARETAAMRRRIHGDRHPGVMHSLHWAGMALQRLENWPEAEAAFTECLVILDNPSAEPRHANSVGLKYNIQTTLAEVLLRQGKFASAEPLLLSSYPGLLQYSTPTTANNLRLTMRRFIRLYEATDRPVLAEEWKQKLADFEKAEAR